MKKRFILVLTSLIILLTACGTKQEVVEEQLVQETKYKTYDMQEEMKTNTIKDGKIQVLTSVITLPIKYSDFKKETELTINSTFTRKIDESTIMQPQEEQKIYLTSNNTDIIAVTVKNREEKNLKVLGECDIIGIDISRTTSQELNESLYGLVYSPYGITYGDNFDIVEKRLEDIEITPIHTRNTATDTMYYKDGNYTLTFFYDSETKEIVQIIYKINN